MLHKSTWVHWQFQIYCVIYWNISALTDVIDVNPIWLDFVDSAAPRIICCFPHPPIQFYSSCFSSPSLRFSCFPPLFCRAACEWSPDLAVISRVGWLTSASCITSSSASPPKGSTAVVSGWSFAGGLNSEAVHMSHISWSKFENLPFKALKGLSYFPPFPHSV